VAVDSSGRVHVAGGSIEGTFPVTEPLWSQASYLQSNAFYAVLPPSLDSLEYSVLFPSWSESEACGIALTGQGFAFLTGKVRVYGDFGPGIGPSCTGTSGSSSLRSLVVMIAPVAGAPPSLYPEALTVPAVNGIASVEVNFPGHAQWQASTNASWITLDQTGGCGSGAVVFRYSANTTGAPRSAEISIGGLKTVITQTTVQPPIRNPYGMESRPSRYRRKDR